MSLTVNSTDFDRKMQAIMTKIIPSAVVKSLNEVAFIILRDADDIQPKTPKDKGNLKRDKFVQKAQRHGTKWNIHFGYKSAYAHRMHEDTNIKNWSEPGSGNKYLEYKVVKLRDKYGKILAVKIRTYGGM
jgi:hypothetical protein